MPRKKGERKEEVRVFLEKVILGKIDELIDEGVYGNRSEAIRAIVDDWYKEVIRR